MRTVAPGEGTAHQSRPAVDAGSHDMAKGRAEWQRPVTGRKGQRGYPLDDRILFDVASGGSGYSSRGCPPASTVDATLSHFRLVPCRPHPPARVKSCLRSSSECLSPRKHPTSNIQHPMPAAAPLIGCWIFDVPKASHHQDRPPTAPDLKPLVPAALPRDIHPSTAPWPLRSRRVSAGGCPPAPPKNRT
jgi:hypothetical protein